MSSNEKLTRWAARRVRERCMAVSAGEVELRQIKELIELMERHGLMEIELHEEGRKIRLRKDASPQLLSAPHVVAAPPAVPAHGTPQIPPASEAKAAAPSGLIEVHSPMVGSLYRAPSPDADPFVEEGDTVKEGDVLCIIEAMKVMNEIKAECTGTIEKIVVENGQAVEYGEVLFLLRPE